MAKPTSPKPAAAVAEALPEVGYQRLKVSLLKPAPYNPRTISAEARAALVASLKEFGLVQPILWNRQSGFVVGGHQRLEAWVELNGLGPDDELGCVVTDLDPLREKALNVTLNNRHIAGDWTADIMDILTEVEVGLGADMWGDLMMAGLYKDAPKVDPGPLTLGVPGEDGAVDPTAPTIPSQGYIKMVQIFIPTEQFNGFMLQLDRLRQAWGTENATETIMEAVRRADDPPV